MTVSDPSSPPLATIDRANLDRDTSPIVLLDEDLRIVWVNSGWGRAAVAQGAPADHPSWRPGEPYLGGTAGPLRPRYERALRRVLGAAQVWEHEYECPSSKIRRRYRMRVLPLRNGDGLAIMHNLVLEAPIDTAPSKRPAQAYVGEGGLISVCGHCRRTRRPDDPNTWDWVPGVLNDPPARLSHGLCRPCMAYYYADAFLDQPT